MKKSLLSILMFTSRLSLIVFAIQLISANLIFAYEASAQMNVRIHTNVSNTTVKHVFDAIESKTAYNFIYDSNNVDVNKAISLNEDLTVKEILNTLETDLGLVFRPINNTITVVNINSQTGNTRASNLFLQTLSKQAQITGTVTDNKGESLPGVSVKVKGALTGSSTDINGQYSLNAPGSSTLVFTYIGFVAQEVAVNNRSSVNVILLEDTQNLEEVVVVGYGTQKKVSVTNSVSQIQGEVLTERPVSNLGQALQGQAPGLTVLDLGGMPGRSTSTIRVRGITTLPDANNPAKNDALVIVDGIEQSLSDINPDDIATVSILKDAASTAIYGSRAANGVILITTKRAKAGKALVTFNSYYALQNTINHPKMDTESYMHLQQVAYQNAGLAIPSMYTDESIKTWMTSNDREQYPLANVWFDELFQTAPQLNSTLSISGGSENFKARMSARYMKQDALISGYGANLGEIRVNTDYVVSKKINVVADLNYRRNDSKAPTLENNVYDRMFHGTLFAVPKYADGSYGLSTQGQSPLVYAELGGVSHRYMENIIGNIKGDWAIIDGLKFTTQLAARIDLFREKSFGNEFTVTDKRYNVTRSILNNSLTETRNNTTEYTINNLLTYDKTFEKHNISALIGNSIISNVTNTLSAYRERFYNNDIQSIGQGANDGTKSNNGGDAEWNLASYFARVNYSLNDKYLFEANGRYDGSSRFTGSNQYSFFPSFSAGWRLSQEELFSNIDVINELKLRGSWGRTGNQAVGLYSYLQALSTSSYAFGSSSVIGYSPTTLSNPDITWETTTQTNIGLDAQLFRNLSITLDYYKKRTDGILINLPIPQTIGLSAPPQNAGVVDNTGLEVALGYRNNSHNIKYSLNGNVAINNNRVISLADTGPYISGDDINPQYIIKEGLPINAHWGYLTDGLFQTIEEINNYPTITTNRKPGDVKFVDLNDDGIINSDDMTMIGSSFPKYTFGFSGNIGYGNFELSAFLQGAAKVDTRLAGALAEMGNNEGFTPALVTKNNYWTPEHPDARFPRPVKRDITNSNTSDRMVIDGSYIRLKNVQLSYTLPQSLIEKLNMTKISVYTSATNLFTISKLNEWGLDPETPSGRATYYPQTSLWTFGLNVQF
ncbi:TonB-dependent receptor [Albibacterium bauzanense]|nr:TonB-dependent receptor [Albibacterium bauzanense]